ncbi:restriction endonuclease subunit S [Lactobacillus equicursoris]|nr:restriction endonuclease subunit S [Lactobacillus equicursoris]
MTKRDAKDEKKAPKLRFKGFTDDWEQVPLENIIKVNSGRDYKFANPGDIPVYGTGGYMLSIDTKLSDEDAVGIGRKGTINKPFFLKAPFWTVDTLFYLTSRNQNNIHFLLPLFQKINWKRYDESTGVPSLSKSTINKIRVNIPKIEEQRNVALLFQSLDHTITLHEEKRKQLEQLKKALLQKMFADKTNFPEIRFNGYVSPWEQVKLGEIFTECTEKSRDGNEPLLSVTINDGVVKSESLDRKSNASKDKSNYKIVRPNNIAYNSMRMWQGAVGVSNYYGIVSPAYTVISLNETTNSPFFYQYYFKKSSSLNTFRKNSQGLTPDTWNLKYPLFKLIKYRIPQYDEQKKIGQLFQKLDYTINLHDQKIEDLKQLKQALLQQMFI